jgi:hypothetical protein
MARFASSGGTRIVLNVYLHVIEAIRQGLQCDLDMTDAASLPVLRFWTGQSVQWLVGFAAAARG